MSGLREIVRRWQSWEEPVLLVGELSEEFLTDYKHGCSPHALAGFYTKHHPQTGRDMATGSGIGNLGYGSVDVQEFGDHESGVGSPCLPSVK